MSGDYARGIYYLNEDELAQGLPLHYYLGRSSNLDIDAKLLVMAFPESTVLMEGDEGSLGGSLSAAFVLSCNAYDGDFNDVYGIMEYFNETNPSCIRTKMVLMHFQYMQHQGTKTSALD